MANQPGAPDATIDELGPFESQVKAAEQQFEPTGLQKVLSSPWIQYGLPLAIMAGKTLTPKATGRGWGGFPTYEGFLGRATSGLEAGLGAAENLAPLGAEMQKGTAQVGAIRERAKRAADLRKSIRPDFDQQTQAILNTELSDYVKTGKEPVNLLQYAKPTTLRPGGRQMVGSTMIGEAPVQDKLSSLGISAEAKQKVADRMILLGLSPNAIDVANPDHIAIVHQAIQETNVSKQEKDALTRQLGEARLLAAGQTSATQAERLQMERDRLGMAQEARENKLMPTTESYYDKRTRQKIRVPTKTEFMQDRENIAMLRGQQAQIFDLLQTAQPHVDFLKKVLPRILSESPGAALPNALDIWARKTFAGSSDVLAGEQSASNFLAVEFARLQTGGVRPPAILIQMVKGELPTTRENLAAAMQQLAMVEVDITNRADSLLGNPMKALPLPPSMGQGTVPGAKVAPGMVRMRGKNGQSYNIPQNKVEAAKRLGAIEEQ